jgi:hypothetical protein
MQGKGLTPLRSQGSPLRSDPFGTSALDFFHPHFKKAIIGLSFRRKPIFFIINFSYWLKTAIFADLTAFFQKTSP